MGLEFAKNFMFQFGINFVDGGCRAVEGQEISEVFFFGAAHALPEVFVWGRKAMPSEDPAQGDERGATTMIDHGTGPI